MPRFTIVLPVYNSASYLEVSLGCALRQTFDDVEVIAVMDPSSDNSGEILDEWAAEDNRLSVIKHGKNTGGLAAARKDGVMASKGEYILFLDADDELTLYACEKLDKVLHEEPVDILHFATNLVNCGGASNKSIEKLKKEITPHAGLLNGSEIFRAAFIDDEILWTAWNKCYESAFCKKCFEMIDPTGVFSAEDAYAFFVLSRFAQTYKGVPDLQIYTYNYGYGQLGKQALDLESFMRLDNSMAARSIQDFSCRANLDGEDLVAVEHARIRLAKHCTYLFKELVEKKDKKDAYLSMIKRWEYEPVIFDALAWRYRNEPCSLYRDVFTYLDAGNRDIKTVGICEADAAKGKIDIPIASKLAGLGYRCVDIGRERKRSIYAEKGTNNLLKGGFYKGSSALIQTIESADIDLLICFSSEVDTMLWDLLIARSLGCRTVLVFDSHTSSAGEALDQTLEAVALAGYCCSGRIAVDDNCVELANAILGNTKSIETFYAADRDAMKSFFEDGCASGRLSEAAFSSLIDLLVENRELIVLGRKAEQDNNRLRSSNSWRAGRLLTALPRMAKRIIRRVHE